AKPPGMGTAPAAIGTWLAWAWAANSPKVARVSAVMVHRPAALRNIRFSSNNRRLDWFDRATVLPRSSPRQAKPLRQGRQRLEKTWSVSGLAKRFRFSGRDLSRNGDRPRHGRVSPRANCVSTRCYQGEQMIRRLRAGIVLVAALALSAAIPATASA